MHETGIISEEVLPRVVVKRGKGFDHPHQVDRCVSLFASASPKTRGRKEYRNDFEFLCGTLSAQPVKFEWTGEELWKGSTYDANFNDKKAAFNKFENVSDKSPHNQRSLLGVGGGKRWNREPGVVLGGQKVLSSSLSTAVFMGKSGFLWHKGGFGRKHAPFFAKGERLENQKPQRGTK